MKRPFARLLSQAILLALMTAGFAAGAATVSDAAPYLLGTCPVTGGRLDSMGGPTSRVYDGKEVRFCCTACIGKYEAERSRYDAEIEARLVVQQISQYPLDTCVVSGGKLSGMGEPVNYIHGNRLVRFCSHECGCIERFEAEPEVYLKRLDEAVVRAQLDNYPLETCVVSGEMLGGAMGEPVNVVAGNRLLRLCCEGCNHGVMENPVKYLRMIEENPNHSNDSDAHGSHGR